ncbi:MAG: hypothetical protein QOE22_196 [Candidatus Parcubacteria bacterium]|jgi:hypothetical protein|nr:hypothetical protein [Candidatus Parcubacteria bacterium]
MKHPKHYRQQIYGYIEELLGRPLTFEEHDDLRDMVSEYVFSTQNIGATIRRFFCNHDWIGDKRIESGAQTRVYVKCVKCDKRTKKRMPALGFDI